MTGASSLLAAVLTVVSVMSLSLLSLLCLRCKRKSKIIHEEASVYDPQTFQRGGSKFKVMRSKTVIRAHQTSPPSAAQALYSEAAGPAAPADQQPEYQNITECQMLGSSQECNYIAPISVDVYENENSTTLGIYGNVFPSLPVENDDDYENSEFLEQVIAEQPDETDEPDYVNGNEDCT